MRFITFSLALILPLGAKIDFATQVQPILSENCYACHGPDEAAVESGLRLDQRELALKGGDSGAAIIPGDAAKSLLIERIHTTDEDDHMPPKHKKDPLTQTQKTILEQWINEGAEWGEHWAFVAPVRPEDPEVKNTSWAKTSIDRFILATLEKNELQPSPKADARTLLRRRSLDLIGLPPKLEWLKNPESITVDHLLASQHHGEKWGREWLDAARYADSSGYEKDLAREMHFYRDWVIKSLNADMGYDEFVIKQIAGDLLPNATQDDIIATGYLRNSMTNEEGGAKPEQFRIEGIFDRMDAIGKGILGVTTQCAQCHTHKYDPLTHDDYFGLFAYLNNMRETSYPAHTKSEKQLIVELKANITASESKLKSDHPTWQAEFTQWKNNLLALPRTEWVTQPIKQIGDNGQKYQNLDDGSVINQGYAATKMSAPFAHETEMKTIRSVRLELLHDPYLPLQGPGRSMHGVAALSEFELRVADKILKLQNAVASVNPADAKLNSKIYPLDAKRSPDDRITGKAHYAIDGDAKTAWTTDRGYGRSNVPQSITFELAEPLENEGKVRIQTNLVQKHGGWNSDENQNFNIGRVRMSFSADLPNVLDQLPLLVLDALTSKKRTAAQEKILFTHWYETQKTQETLSAHNTEIDALWKTYPRPTVALVTAKRHEPRGTRLYDRGEQTKPKHIVKPHTPSFLHPISEGKTESRLTMAKWLVDRKSPTTARTIVNRIWQSYFGKGIVETTEDLGLQSPQPSHPELLDWLAVELMENKWSLKHIHKLITTSAVYEQESRHNSLLREKDPDNRLLARGPRLRVNAEIIRDIHLSTSGLINLQVGGRSVFPTAPDFLFQKPSSYGPKSWTTETDTQRYRRALYTFRFRSVTYPMLVAFDAPSGESACIRRTVSTTPLQALVTLNEPMSVEAAVALGTRILNESTATAFEHCTSRPPNPEELAVLDKVYQRELAHYQADQKATQDLLGTYKPIGLTIDSKSAELAAATAVAQVLLNLDETITKN